MSPEQDGFRIFDHTADIGIEAHGADLAQLFSNAAAGMFAIIASPKTVKPRKQIQVKTTADDLENLLVNWLSELLYLSSTQMMLFINFEIIEIDHKHISAKVLGEPIDTHRHDLYTEIKAVTYHDLTVQKHDRGYLARVLFDI